MSEEKQKKPFYKKWWFWLIIALFVFSSIGRAERERAKKAAGAFDERLYNIVRAVDACYTNLDDRGQHIINTGDLSEILGVSKLLAQYAEKVDEISADAKTQEALAYVAEVRAYTANTRVIVESIYNYVNTWDQKYVEQNTRCKDKQIQIQVQILESREEYLKTEGWTRQEIKALYSK